MNRAFVPLLLLIAIPGCSRYPTGIAPIEQVQALVYSDLVSSEVFYRESAGDDAMRLFLSYDEPQTDAAPSVQAYVARAFRSVRPASASVRSTQTGIYSERTTGQPGILLHIEPFSVSAWGPLTVRATTHYESGSAGYAYRLEQVKGRWRVIDHERLWIRCK